MSEELLPSTGPTSLTGEPARKIKKPERFSPRYAEPFKDLGVVQAYQHRPPYADEVFDILAGLVAANRRCVLDAGCGTGNIARHLVERDLRVDAVDFSQYMLDRGKELTNGNHPSLRWLCGKVEEIEDSALDSPYGLVTAGESLHWMDWNVVLPRFHKLLAEGAYLAIVEQRVTPDPWSTLGEVVERYRTDGGYQPYNMLDELERHGLFRKVGMRETRRVQLVQSIDHFIESYHARSGLLQGAHGRGACNCVRP
ncbi:MAG: hypothetical protein QOH93_1703 [Chloroflexia bacterium]|jgi:SAM-dependent methyltransferase|nr:hypothetical protein [Chloroflexia bacterium]